MHFRDLNEAQILALAVSAEEEDARIYRDFAESLRADFPATAELFTRMAEEEDGHRQRLSESYRQRFGEHHQSVRDAIRLEYDGDRQRQLAGPVIQRSRHLQRSCPSASEPGTG